MTVCEIDERVVDNVRKYFKINDSIEEEQKKKRLEIVFEDGGKYVKDCLDQGMSFDGIIIDNTDIDENHILAKTLFTVEFYKVLHKLLKKNCSFSQQVTDLVYSNIFKGKVKEAGFNEIDFIYSNTPEYSIALPLGVCTKN